MTPGNKDPGGSQKDPDLRGEQLHVTTRGQPKSRSGLKQGQIPERCVEAVRRMCVLLYVGKHLEKQRCASKPSSTPGFNSQETTSPGKHRSTNTRKPSLVATGFKIFWDL